LRSYTCGTCETICSEEEIYCHPYLEEYNEWRPFAHVAVDHQPLTALEQWKVSGLLTAE